MESHLADLPPTTPPTPLPLPPQQRGVPLYILFTPPPMSLDTCWQINVEDLNQVYGGRRDPQTGRTLLHNAASQGNSDIVRWLIEGKKINIAAQDLKGVTVLECVTILGCAAGVAVVEVVEYLMAHHAPEDADHLLKIVRGMGTDEEKYLEVVACVLRYTKGETLNYIDHHYYTPLACACVRGYAKVAHLLLLAGAEAYETYPFSHSNAVKWDPGNRNALVKAKAIFGRDSAKKRAARLRCVALIETVPRVVLLHKCRELHGATDFLRECMGGAVEEIYDIKKEIKIAEKRERLRGMSFLCDRVEPMVLPVIEINDKGADEVVVACVQHVVKGGLLPDVWHELLEMLDV